MKTRAAVALLMLAVFATAVSVVESATEEELQSRISERTDAIKTLEAEITAFQQQLQTLGKEKASLQNEIKTLDLTRKKLQTDIKLTETKISRSNLRLEELADDIDETIHDVSVTRQALAESLRSVQIQDDRSIIETILSSRTVSEVGGIIETIEYLQDKLQEHITVLQEAKETLEDSHADETKVKSDLISLKRMLDDQKRLVDINAKEKNTLLTKTKNSEAGYRKLIEEKAALRDAFEQELLKFESELSLLKSPSDIPPPAPLLSWPVSPSVITQQFGDTAFARDHSQVYGGKGHNGIDLRAPTGTVIKSAYAGTVVGVGDTDTVCPNASYGKWVLIRHPNGLSTLYAHFSIVKVSEGDEVLTNDLLGYSGSTGYATGPHLHFTVYATAGVQITERKSRICAGAYKMPIADLKAYLNPVLYLPPL